MKIHIINTEKGQIEYSVCGEGKPVLFLHGGHSNCRETLFHKGFDLEKYQLIIPSRPGYGNTPGGLNTSPGKTADLIVLLLDHLKLDKVVLYAISAGGLSAIEMAANYPERVEKLILASAVTKKWLDKSGKVYKTAKKLFNPTMEKLTWGMVRLFSGVFPVMIANNFYPQFSSNKPHKLAKKDIQELLGAFKFYNSKTGFMYDIEHDIEEDQIARINCPCLIVHSKNDNSVSFEHAEFAYKMIKNATLLGLDNEWGHLFWIGHDSSEPINKIIEFIEL